MGEGMVIDALAAADKTIAKLKAEVKRLKKERREAIKILSGVIGGEDRAVDAAVKLLNANKEIEW